MLTKITLENFKLFKSVTIEPALVTLLIGPNGTGKSSIIQALMLLRQSGFGGVLNLNGSAINLGSFNDVVHGHDDTLTVTLGLEAGEDGSRSTHQCSYSSSGQPRVKTEDPRHFIQNLLPAIRFVRPTRGLDQPTYRIEADKGNFAELPRFDSRATNVVTTLWLASDEVRARLTKWAMEITGRGIAVRNAPGPQAFLAAPEGGDKYTNVVLEGFGLNQLAELLLQLAEAQRGSLLCIEEPEIHLHPGAQAKLGHVLGREAKQREIQLLMTTHSEHLLMSFLTQVAKKELRSEDLAVYYFERKNGYAEAERLEVTEKGTIRSGMRGFFEVGLEELEEYVKARLGQA